MIEPTGENLYRRLGGYDAIAAATDELLDRLMSDPLLRDYWKGASHDNQRHARQLIVDFMVEASGGPAYYTGRTRKSSHHGMGIDGRDWEAFTHHAAGTLDHLGVATPESEEVLTFLAGLREDVVDGEQ